VPAGIGLLLLVGRPDDPIARTATYVYPLEVRETREVLVLFPAKSPALHGVVVDESGRPVRDARIQASAKGRERGCMQTRTRADGTFELPAIRGAQTAATVRAEGYAEDDFTLNDEYPDPARRMVVKLETAATLAMSVRDTRGAPQQGLDLGVRPSSDHEDDRVRRFSHRTRRCRTDREGRCEIRALPTDVPLDVRLERDGRILRDELSVATLGPVERREVELVIHPGVRVNGRLIDQRGLAIPGARVGIGDSSNGDSSGRGVSTRTTAEEVTGADGEFSFDDIQPGTWRIGPVPPLEGLEDLSFAAQPVQIPAGKSQVDVTVTAYRGLFIRGKVLSTDGEAVGGVTVSIARRIGDTIREQRVRTDPEGRFALGPLVPGWFDLQTRAPDSRPVRARPGDADVILRTVRAGRIEGIVVDRRTSKPVDARILVDCEGHTNVHSTLQVSGRFSIDHPSGGSCNLRAITPDARIGSLRDVRVRPSEPIEGLVIGVQAAAILELESESRDYFRVLDSRGDVACELSSSDPRCVLEAGGVVIERVVMKRRDDVTEITVEKESRLTLGSGERRRLVFR
jgi:hypothetical protein